MLALILFLKEEKKRWDQGSAVNLSFSFRTPLTFYHLWAHHQSQEIVEPQALFL